MRHPLGATCGRPKSLPAIWSNPVGSSTHPSTNKQKGALLGPFLVCLAERVGLSLRDRACGFAAAPVDQCSHPQAHSARKAKGPRGDLLLFWRRGWDSNPRRAINPCWFSRPVHSTALPPLQTVIPIQGDQCIDSVHPCTSPYGRASRVQIRSRRICQPLCHLSCNRSATASGDGAFCAQRDADSTATGRL